MTSSATLSMNETVAERPRVRHKLRNIAEGTPVLQVLGVIVLVAYATITIPGFLGRSSLNSTLVLAAFLGIAATGQTLVILLGGIDLSVPAVISGANLMTPMLVGKGMPFGAAFAVVILAAGAVGAINGYLVRRLRLSALVFTLASGAIVTGFTLAWSHSGTATGAIPAWLANFSSPVGRTFGLTVPPVIVVWAAVAIGLGIVLHRTVTGRHVYATATNELAASIAGIRTRRIWVGAFTVSALSAACLGVLLDGFVGAPTLGVGAPYLFTSLTAVMVGGTSLVGGRGDYWRTVLGALIVTLISTLLVSRGAGQGLQELLFGLLILLFVGLYGRDRRVRDRI